ncbi:uncharacterized protein LOC129249411 [Anastrepha obliqua]|uniref:uncharacterized protein LOC129249411 n=1 Tax=Anastrepha obliqua TaxID=95512 RepID=UPI002409AAD7|nr:uncharacterized protein LOC129249411 [Anastrepha obliqua]
MKTAIIFLAIVAFATAGQDTNLLADRSLSTTAEQILVDIRDQMPCGFPSKGIPPLAPLKIPHKEVNIDTESLKLQGVVDNFRLNGLNEFEIDEMKINAITSKVTFRLIFSNVNVDTQYDLSAILKKAGFTINLVGNGQAKFAVKNIDISGTIKYSLGILSGKLKLKTLSISTHIGEVESDIQGILGSAGINEKMNEMLEEVVQLAVNENEETITETIESIALPKVNNFLNDNSIFDLINSGNEKVECIPPSDN